MSKVLGIIAEYNPFHNGHLYHLEQSKKQTGCTYSVAIISGNFTQRGSTSLVDKWEKASCALANGIDLVIELPTIYATSSAENFAEGSIKILDSLKIIDYLSFGSECGDIETLDKIANILYKEPKDFKLLLTKELNSNGVSYPKACQNALKAYLTNTNNKNCTKYISEFSSPNNILGIEYLKALKKYKSKIKPLSIMRYESGHNEVGFNNNFASSTAIRNILKNDGIKILRKFNSSCNTCYVSSKYKKWSCCS